MKESGYDGSNAIDGVTIDIKVELIVLVVLDSGKEVHVGRM